MVSPVITNPGVPPVRFDRAMVFIDGTNLFYRLEAERLTLQRGLPDVIKIFIGGRKNLRIYMYTIQEHLARALSFHGDNISNGIRLVYGLSVQTGDGNVREKGVDALLVADLVYHAAVRNYDYALVVSADVDFAQALRRVEDFGCRTGVVAVCTPVPAGLQDVCDDTHSYGADDIVSSRLAVRRVD